MGEYHFLANDVVEFEGDFLEFLAVVGVFRSKARIYISCEGAASDAVFLVVAEGLGAQEIATVIVVDTGEQLPVPIVGFV